MFPPVNSTLYKKNKDMKKIIILLILVTAFSSCIKKGSDLNLKNYFKNYNSCFVLYNLQTDITKRYNNNQCEVQLTPCSTFLIANALIGLETGILKKPTQTLKWDRTKYPIKTWNRNLTLKEAIAASDEPKFKEIAKKIGSKRMKEYLNKFSYGNKDITGGISKFWLGSTLKISANEQVKFLRKVLLDKKILSKNNLNVMQDILEVKKTCNGILYGKTGTEEGLVLGWFVGFFKTNNGKTYIFATNIKAKNNASGQVAKEITINILKDQKII
jgi:beta-lactamase class D